ncbi:DNA-directed DNA polymerase [Purpureocillium takamizusanense]|uniref:DNA-directed DNA polymerase n=1 Tax=Purpureocillium takamizusanense TaxID=2060973 RepID=A0A9Q8V764_9HYPO|nr:DNA-directed DNA polymerase [Purpureocillium takamizusanense]UNI14507.1 DNA-directed DNA polymerase [Purpureocillium takamizusanense]
MIVIDHGAHPNIKVIPRRPDFSAAEKAEYSDGSFIRTSTPRTVPMVTRRFFRQAQVAHDVSQPTHLFLDQGDVGKNKKRLAARLSQYSFEEQH